MTKRSTYLDSGILIAAFRGTHELSTKALEILDDEEREFVISDALKLETLPKPRFLKRYDEVAFMEAFFECASKIEISAQVTQTALQVASQHDIHPLDSLQIAAAICAEVSEFITNEKPSKPMFRVTDIKVISLRASSDASGTEADGDPN